MLDVFVVVGILGYMDACSECKEIVTAGISWLDIASYKH